MKRLSFCSKFNESHKITARGRNGPRYSLIVLFDTSLPASQRSGSERFWVYKEMAKKGARNKKQERKAGTKKAMSDITTTGKRQKMPSKPACP